MDFRELVTLYTDSTLDTFRAGLKDHGIFSLQTMIKHLKSMSQEIEVEITAQDLAKSIDVAVKEAHGRGYREDMKLSDFIRVCVSNNISLKVRYDGIRD